MSVRDKGSRIFRIGIDLANKAAPRGMTFESDCAGERLAAGALMYFVAKGSKTYQAIDRLWCGDLVEDAGILARTLFEMALQAIHIRRSPEAHGMLWYEYLDVEKYRQYRDIARIEDDAVAQTITGLQPDDVEHLKRIYNERKARYPRRQWWGESIYWLAHQAEIHAASCLDRLDYKTRYWVQSNWAHSSILALPDYVDEVDDKARRLYHPSPATDLAIPLDATTCLAIVIESWNTILKVGIEEDIKTACRELESFLPMEDS